MSALNLGDELWVPGATSAVMEVTSPTPKMGRVRVLEADVATERWILYEEIRAQIEVGALEVRRSGNPALAVFMDRTDPTTRKCNAARRRTVASEDAYLSSLSQATRIVRVLKDYCARYRVSAYAAYPEVRSKFESERTQWRFPSVATVYRLLERDRCNAPLVKPNHVKGNRTERYSKDVVDLICTVAEATFLKEMSVWTFRTLTDHCRRTAIAQGLLCSSARLSQKFVRKVVNTRLHAMPDVARLLSKDRSSKAAVAKHRIRVNGVFQRVEQDAVHLPFAIRTLDGPCYEAWLIHAIDCATSNVVGWYLKLGAPNESDGLRCIESTLYSKGAKFKSLAVDEVVELYGLPGLLVLDNGPEAKGERFRRLTQLKMDVEYCKARHPQQKPFVERLNRSLKEALETLPGCTRMNGKDGARDPIALGDDLMTIEELERWVVRWYYEKWTDTPLKRFIDEDVYEDRGLGITPRQRFESLVMRLGHPLPLPPNRNDWVRIQYNVVLRKLSIKSGISHHGYEFKGDNLGHLIARYGESQVEVLSDPEDFRRVYVLDRGELVELQNQSAGSVTPAHTFSKAKQGRTASKKGHPETRRSATFVEDVHSRSTATPKRTSTQRKMPGHVAKKEVIEKIRDREAIARAAKHPLAEPKPKFAPEALVPMRLDDVDELSPRDRKTGAQL